jgi:hypothetical protein
MNRNWPTQDSNEAALRPRDGRNAPPLYGGAGFERFEGQEDPAFRDDARYAWAYPEASAHGHHQSLAQRAGYELGRLFGRRVPKGYKRSDERIREDVSECLSDHPELDPTDIEVTVSEGEVTLAGTVADRRAKKLAELLIESVRGVDEVHNRLEIRR